MTIIEEEKIDRANKQKGTRRDARTNFFVVFHDDWMDGPFCENVFCCDSVHKILKSINQSKKQIETTALDAAPGYFTTFQFSPWQSRGCSFLFPRRPASCSRTYTRACPSTCGCRRTCRRIGIQNQ